ncbi:MAG: hypothetical protein K6E91_05735 [Butyrivibrio sp.]|nr:hypothetical protein [Butyrivibrio sp.]
MDITDRNRTKKKYGIESKKSFPLNAEWKALSEKGAVNRLVAILLVLVIIMLGILAIPAWNAFQKMTAEGACEQAMKSASDGLVIDFLFNDQEEGSAKEAMAVLDDVMPGRENICPTGGTVYLVRNEDGVIKPVCGLHNSDDKLKTRLNASRALDLLEENLRKKRRQSETEPESIIIELNGKELDCVRTDREWYLARGTKKTKDYEGVVCFYGLSGEGAFSNSSAKKNKICYFVYADEEHCAIWHIDDGWTGDAYEEIG